MLHLLLITLIFPLISAEYEISLFDPRTNEPIEAPYVEYLRGRNDLKEEGEAEGGEEEGDRPGFPCSCQTRMCGCCFGMNLGRWNISQNLCGNMVYDPLEFSMTFNMMLNERELYSRSWSGKNPPPMCVPIPIPYVPIQMEMCMKAFNVFQPGNNLHMCMDMEFMVQKIKMMILHFDCMRIGQDFAFMKPEENGGVDEEGNIIKKSLIISN